MANPVFGCPRRSCLRTTQCSLRSTCLTRAARSWLGHVPTQSAPSSTERLLSPAPAGTYRIGSGPKREVLVGVKGAKTPIRAPMVLMDESAQDIAASDLREGPCFRVQSRIGRLKLEAPMRPGQVVVLGVRPEDAAQVTPAEDQDVVEAR